MVSPLTDLKIYRKLHTTSKQQTDDADEYTDVASPRELPVVGWQQKGPRRMDRGGRAERDLSPVSADGLKLGGTAEVADFCPKGTIGMGPCGMKVFFFFSKGPQIRKEHAP